MSPTKKTSARKSTVKKTTSSKASSKKPVAKKTRGPKAPTRAVASKKTSSKATKAKKTSVKKTSKKSTASAKKSTIKKTTAPGKRTPGKSASRSRPRREAKFDKAQLASIRKQLSEERADLEHQIQELEESSFQGTQSDVAGEMGSDDDFADAGTATFERERDLSIQNNIRDLIDQISRAMERIDEGTYGTCERCGRPIDAARLKALPHALLCMDCKRREERAR